MRMITLPQTDLTVSQICLGTAEFGVKTDEAGAFGLMDAFSASGGNFVDTAHCYADWVPGELSRSEKLIGRWLAKRGNRDSVVLATKGGVNFPSRGQGTDLSEQALDKDLDETGLGVTALCLLYISSQPDFAGVPIIFTSSEVRLQDSLAGADAFLTPAQRAFLEDEMFGICTPSPDEAGSCTVKSYEY